MVSFKSLLKKAMQKLAKMIMCGATAGAASVKAPPTASVDASDTSTHTPPTASVDAGDTSTHTPPTASVDASDTTHTTPPTVKTGTAAVTAPTRNTGSAAATAPPQQTQQAVADAVADAAASAARWKKLCEGGAKLAAEAAWDVGRVARMQKLHRDAAAKTRKRLHGAAPAAQLFTPRPSPATMRAVKAVTGFSATLATFVAEYALHSAPLHAASTNVRDEVTPERHARALLKMTRWKKLGWAITG
jgi:hypothetical protein